MSGFAAVVDFAGRVVDGEVWADMRGVLARTAPHGGGEHVDGGVALAYAHFEVDPERPRGAMPLTLDGRRWIAGDLRLDARDELCASLGARESEADAALVLRAYERWGAECASRLTGDFAFVIWDAATRELYAARDPFGVRPFYYASRDGLFVASSALAAVRRHSAVSDRLDDDAIAEMLLFSIVLDPARTTFADVQTLPAGHVLRADAGGVTVTRWFTLPMDEPLRFRDRRELLDTFNEHLRRAVSDRIGGPALAISMSGGLDSTSIATVAAEVMKGRYAQPRILAQTIVFDPLVPDDEERFAIAVARGLGMEHEIIRADRHRLFERWDLPGYRKEEPTNDPFSAITTDQFRRAAEHAPVMLSGQGGDVVFYASHPYFYNLLRRGRLDRFFGEIAGFVVRKRRMPPLCLRSSYRRARGIRPAHPPFPVWIAPSLVESLHLHERWTDYWNDLPQVHPTRPQAYGLLGQPGWQRLHEYTDAAAMDARIVYRNPYLDLRLVRFLLRVPPMPWFAEKELLREAMRGRLHEDVRTRRKRPIGSDPAHVWMSRQADELSASLDRAAVLDRWVDRDRVRGAIRSPSRTLYDSYLLSLPLSLAFWLENRVGK
jgi:asparagine synthase (glutamine-hydrolysing)